MSMLIPLCLVTLATAALVGLASRIAALCILIMTTWLQGESALNAVNTAMIISSAWLMLLGAGRFSLWQWDDRWVNRRDGEDNS